MSRQLPEKPNLSFLKKQAKDVLRGMPQGRLAEAQQLLANEYGFASWAKLKFHVESLGLTPPQAFKAAIFDSDAGRVRALLAQHPELREVIDRPLPDTSFGVHAMFAAVQRSDRATINALLDAGADMQKRTEWWAGGFGVLDDCDASLVEFLLERGAVMDAHAAARLGRREELRALVAKDPAVVRAPGADGQTPLHFALTVEVAEFLLENGADMNALDVDHESTPAQYMLRVQHARHYAKDRQDVARYLVARGCKTDLLLAAALGDVALTRRILDQDPKAIGMSVSDEWFPKRDPRAGGTIYLWMLGPNRTAHTVARDFGHEDVFALLMERTPEELRLALACELGDEAAFREFLAAHPDAVNKLSVKDKQKLPDAAQSHNLPAVRLMLQAGWPVDTPGEAGATALHWAAFLGNAEMVREILRFRPALELKSREYAGTALSWGLYGSGNSWRRDSGDYVGVVQALLDAGAVMPAEAEEMEPSEAVLELLP